jgi:aryl-alcohol dehydrogenase-like predicted oxidoreductase
MTRERIADLPDNDWRKNDPRFQELRLSGALALVERPRTIADRHGTTPGSVAVAWTLRNPAVDGAIVGLRRPDQVDSLVAAAGLWLEHGEVSALDSHA